MSCSDVGLGAHQDVLVDHYGI